MPLRQVSAFSVVAVCIFLWKISSSVGKCCSLSICTWSCQVEKAFYNSSETAVTHQAWHKNYFQNKRYRFGRWGLKPGSRAKLGEAWDVNLSNCQTNSTPRWNHGAGVVVLAVNAAWRQECAQGSSVTMWVKSGSTAYQLSGEGGEEDDLGISSQDKCAGFSVFFVPSAFINLYKMLWILGCSYFELILLLLAFTLLWLMLKTIAR